jgi:nucleotide-binding universal stress UspA family protein
VNSKRFQRRYVMNAVTETKGSSLRDSAFTHVLVGVDGSEESREAVRQAATVADSGLTLLAAYDVAPWIVGDVGYQVPDYFDEDVQRGAAMEAVLSAREDAATASPITRIVGGRPAEALIAEAEREQDTLLVVGSDGHSRLAGFVLGSTATEVIHKAPCSVLVARRRSEGNAFPNKIVVGVDGSPESAAAYAVARDLSARFDAELWPVVAHGGKSIDQRLIESIVDRPLEDLPGEPVDALLTAAADADLLVVGSRGIHGLRSLGSVSERVAHQARGSVLIVRTPTTRNHDDEEKEAS